MQTFALEAVGAFGINIFHHVLVVWNKNGNFVATNYV